MYKTIKFLFLILVGLGLASCFGYSKMEERYLASKNGNMLVIPRSLAPDEVNHFYDLAEKDSDINVDINKEVIV